LFQLEKFDYCPYLVIIRIKRAKKLFFGRKTMKKAHAAQILENAQKINQLYDAINKTVLNRIKDPEAWQNACKAFHDNYDTLAFPGGLAHSLALLKTQDQETIKTAIAYLKTDPYFHRSGYIKQKIARLLKQAPLTQAQIKELQEILIDAIKKYTRREYLEYCRLARKIADASFDAKIQAIIDQSSDAQIIARAQQMLG
jgi:hypothetical protein